MLRTCLGVYTWKSYNNGVRSGFCVEVQVVSHASHFIIGQPLFKSLVQVARTVGGVGSCTCLCVVRSKCQLSGDEGNSSVPRNRTGTLVMQEEPVAMATGTALIGKMPSIQLILQRKFNC